MKTAFGRARAFKQSREPWDCFASATHAELLKSGTKITVATLRKHYPPYTPFVSLSGVRFTHVTSIRDGDCLQLTPLLPMKGSIFMHLDSPVIVDTRKTLGKI